MEMNYEQFYNNPFWALIEGNKLRVLAYIINHWDNASVQIILSSGKDEYEECLSLWELVGGRDTGCTNTQNNICKFIKNTILGVATYKNEEQIRITQTRIQQLHEEVKQLEQVLKERST